MKKFGKDKVALFLTCMSVFVNRTSAMNANKAQNPQPVVAVGGATSRNNRSVKQGLSKNQKLAIGGAVSLAVVSAVGFTIWGVKLHNDKKLLESALAFLNSKPVIVHTSDKEICENFDQTVNQLLSCLTSFKEGKTDELKKEKIEIEVGGGIIIIKMPFDDDDDLKFVISKIDDESWKVKKYSCNIKERKEKLDVEVTLGVGKPKTISNDEKEIKEKEASPLKELDGLQLNELMIKEGLEKYFKF